VLTPSFFLFQTVYEFFGCKVHGCPTHTRAYGINPYGISFEDAYFRAVRKIELLSSLPEVEEVTVMWACEWRERKKTDAALKHFLEHDFIQPTSQPLHPRSCLRGGLVEATANYFNAEDFGTLIRKKDPAFETPKAFLVDFNSLYPAMVMNPNSGPFQEATAFALIPHGAPIVLRGDECMAECSAHCLRKCGRFDRHRCQDQGACTRICSLHHPPAEYGSTPGMISCTILPPKNVRFPVLTIKIRRQDQDLTVATCCAQCANEKNCLSPDFECTHTDAERAISGHYMLSEVAYAIRVQGYQLLRVFEVHYFAMYRTDFFIEAMKIYGRLKVTSTAPPPEVDRLQYAQELSRTTGFDNISPDEIGDFPARRTYAKLSLVGSIGKKNPLALSLHR